MWKKAFFLVGISLEPLLGLYLAVTFGQKLDGHFNTGSTITLILVFLFLLLWFYQLIRFLKQIINK